MIHAHVGVPERLLEKIGTTNIKEATNQMGRPLRSGNTTEFDPSLLGRAGRFSKKKSSNGGGADDVDHRRVTTRARAKAEQHQEDRREQVRNRIPEAPPTPDRATLLLNEESGRGRAMRGEHHLAYILVFRMTVLLDIQTTSFVPDASSGRMTF